MDKVTPILRYFVGTSVRHMITIVLTLWTVRNWMGHDIAVKLMHGDTITLWNGYTFNLQTMIEYAVNAFCISILPILIGVYMRARSKLKQRIALWLPSQDVAGGEERVNEILSSTPKMVQFTAALTSDPQKIIDHSEALKAAA